MRIYWAAPFFDAAFAAFNADAAHLLRAAGHEVFLPQEALFNVTDYEPTAEEIFLGDYAEILSADMIIATLDGPVIDDGVAAELGLAFARGIACTGLLTDLRQHRSGSGRLYRNLFVIGLLESSGGIYASMEALLGSLPRGEL